MNKHTEKMSISTEKHELYSHAQHNSRSTSFSHDKNCELHIALWPYSRTNQNHIELTTQASVRESGVAIWDGYQSM